MSEPTVVLDVIAEIIVRAIYFLIGFVATWLLLFYSSRALPGSVWSTETVPEWLEPVFGVGAQVPGIVILGVVLSLAVGAITMLMGPQAYHNALQADIWTSTKNIGDD